MLALFTAQEAAVIASGHGSSLTAPIGTGTVDGFAAGIVLSGVVFMLILAQRRALRSPARAGTSATPAGRTARAQAPDDAPGPTPPQPLAAPVEMAAAVPAEMADPAYDEAAALALVGAAAAAAAESAACAPVEVPAFGPVDAARPTPGDSPPWKPVVEPAFMPITDAVLNMAFNAPAPADNQADAIPDLSTHPYADVSPYGGVSSSTEFLPFADAANEVLLQPGVRLEEWLEGQMRRPSLPRTSRAPVAGDEKEKEKPPAPIPSAVVAAEATTAVVPATPAALATPAAPAPEAVEDDDTVHHRRAAAYQSKHRLAGRNDSKPSSDNHRRTARHAAASSARSGTMSRMFSLRQLRPVSAGD